MLSVVTFKCLINYNIHHSFFQRHIEGDGIMCHLERIAVRICSFQGNLLLHKVVRDEGKKGGILVDECWMKSLRQLVYCE